MMNPGAPPIVPAVPVVPPIAQTGNRKGGTGKGGNRNGGKSGSRGDGKGSGKGGSSGNTNGRSPRPSGSNSKHNSNKSSKPQSGKAQQGKGSTGAKSSPAKVKKPQVRVTGEVVFWNPGKDKGEILHMEGGGKLTQVSSVCGPSFGVVLMFFLCSIYFVVHIFFYYGFFFHGFQNQTTFPFKQADICDGVLVEELDDVSFLADFKAKKASQIRLADDDEEGDGNGLNDTRDSVVECMEDI
jgi:hypothetical protein